MTRVGVCEDDPAIRRVVVEALRLSDHDVVTAHRGDEAIRSFSGDGDVDVLVLDIALPDADGRDVCQALRSVGQRVPVLFLTALGTVHDRLAGFSAGGDDYLPKPFDVRELVARVDALARRSPSLAGKVADLVLDPAGHSLRAGGSEVLLTPTEFRMLGSLTSRPGEVVRRSAVVAAAWPHGAQVSENTVDSYIRRIRTKLEQVGSGVTLQTVRGVGFRLL